MKKYFSSLLSFFVFLPAFAEKATPNKNPFKDAPWCHMRCGKIHLIVWGTILGTIGLQIILLYTLPRMKKLKKWQKYTLYGILTILSLAVAAYLVPPYLKDGFVIGRCFIGDPMGCQ